MVAGLLVSDPAQARSRQRHQPVRTAPHAKRVQVPAPPPKKLVVCEPVVNFHEYPGLVGLHSPACEEEWVRKDEVSGVRPTSTKMGAPEGARTELFFHDTRSMYVTEKPEEVAAAIGGLILLHAPTNSPVWVNPLYVLGITKPIPGILGPKDNRGARCAISMNDQRNVYVLETPRQVTAAVSASIKSQLPDPVTHVPPPE